MIYYHGTHNRNARRIQMEGFHPRGKTNRVWFTKDQNYAKRRAKSKAGRGTRPIVLKCQINIPALRTQLGSGRVVQRGGILMVRGIVPPTVLISHPLQYIPFSHAELATWVNAVLGVKAYKGVSPKHPGIDRLFRWIKHRTEANPNGQISDTELLRLAQQWLPEFFENRRIDFERLRALPMPSQVEQEDPEPVQQKDREEDEALERLLSDKPKQRIRGLSQLHRIHPPDLFEICALFLDDNDLDVRVSALDTMLTCDDVDTHLVESLADDENKRIRAGAIAVLAHHGGDESADWFRFGLTDPDAHVRIQTARILEDLDPKEHRPLFELALYDPNPKIADMARKFTGGKGFAKETW